MSFALHVPSQRTERIDAQEWGTNKHDPMHVYAEACPTHHKERWPLFDSFALGNVLPFVSYHLGCNSRGNPFLLLAWQSAAGDLGAVRTGESARSTDLWANLFFLCALLRFPLPSFPPDDHYVVSLRPLALAHALE